MFNIKAVGQPEPWNDGFLFLGKDCLEKAMKSEPGHQKPQEVPGNITGP